MEVKITDHGIDHEKIMFRMLDMSTIHIRQETLEKLQHQETPATSFEKSDDVLGPLGAFVHVPDEFDFEYDLQHREDSEEYYPPDLLECMRFAIKNEADWIMFDRVGAIYKELPLYTSNPKEVIAVVFPEGGE